MKRLALGLPALLSLESIVDYMTDLECPVDAHVSLSLNRSLPLTFVIL